MTEDRLPISREQILDCVLGDGRSYIADQFGKYAMPVYLGRFLTRYELLKKVLDVPGSILECGVGSGSGLISWYQLSKMLEPLNRRRIIYGFDTFDGFPNVHPKDGDHKAGEQNFGIYHDIERCIAMQCQNHIIMRHDETNWLKPTRFLLSNPWHQIVTVKGDFMKTADGFLKDNQHIVVALLYLDFDLYEPTKRAIELFVPRMPKGSLICFDELDHPDWPGETLAALETVGVRNLQLKRLPWEPTMAYAVLS